MIMHFIFAQLFRLSLGIKNDPMLNGSFFGLHDLSLSYWGQKRNMYSVKYENFSHKCYFLGVIKALQCSFLFYGFNFSQHFMVFFNSIFLFRHLTIANTSWLHEIRKVSKSAPLSGPTVSIKLTCQIPKLISL